MRFRTYQDCLSNEELLTGLLETNEADLLMELQQKLNVVFKFVPSIDRVMGFNPPVNLEEIRRIRKFSVVNKYIEGLELKFCEILKLPIEINNLKKIKQIRLKGNFSELNSNEIINAIKDLKGIQEIFLSSRLVYNLEKTSLKNIKKIGKIITPLRGAQDFPY